METHKKRTLAMRRNHIVAKMHMSQAGIKQRTDFNSVFLFWVSDSNFYPALIWKHAVVLLTPIMLFKMKWLWYCPPSLLSLHKTLSNSQKTKLDLESCWLLGISVKHNISLNEFIFCFVFSLARLAPRERSRIYFEFTPRRTGPLQLQVDFSCDKFSHIKGFVTIAVAPM